jgi:hypothetical protein
MLPSTITWLKAVRSSRRSGRTISNRATATRLPTGGRTSASATPGSLAPYCGKVAELYDIETLAERIETAFERHYTRTSTEPDAIQWIMMKDKESDYDWEREGEPVVWAIANAALISEEAAADIQRVLEDKFASYDDIGYETDFDSES